MQELSLSDLITPLRRNWLLIAIITFSVTLLAILHTYYFVPTIWMADTSIVFEERAGAGLGTLRQFGIADVLVRQGGHGEFMEFLVNSRSVRGGVVDSLDLVEQFGVTERIHAVNRLGGMTEVELPTPGVLVLRVKWPDEPRAVIDPQAQEPAEMAARIAQAMIASLEDEVSHNAYTEAARKLQMLEEQLDRAGRELQQAEDALIAYAVDQGMISPGDQSSAAVSELRSLQSREAELTIEMDELRSRERTAQQRLSNQDRMAISTLSESLDPSINALKRRVLELQQGIAEQREVWGKSEEHPDVASLRSELNTTEEQLAELLKSQMQVDRQTHSIDPSYSTLVDTLLSSSLRASGLQASMDAVRSLKASAIQEIDQLPEKTTQYARIQRQVEIKSQTVASLTESYEMARIAEATSTTSFSVVDEAVMPLRASGPSLRKPASMAFILSLFFSLILVYWLHGRREAARANDHEATAEEA